MKVAMTIEFFDPAKGGGETYARHFARALLAAGHEVHVYANDHGPEEPGVTFHRVPPTPFKLYRRYAFAMRVKALLEGTDYDIIHGFGKSVHMDLFRPGGGVHRAWMDHELRAVGPGPARWLTWLRQRASLDERLVLRLERRQFAGEEGPHLIANSQLVCAEMQQHYGTPDHRISIIYNGVDLERHHPRNRDRFRADMRRELDLTDDEVTLLFIGHNFKRKGLQPIIRALPALRATGVPFRLIVVGGDRPTRYAALAARLGVGYLIQYAGVAEQAERYYAASDIFVFPSWYDPCANVCLEALANGLPVITSTTNGSGELITPGVEGFVVDCEDTAGLATSIAHFFDADTRREAAGAARALAATRPISRNVEEVLQLYEHVLEKKRSGRT